MKGITGAKFILPAALLVLTAAGCVKEDRLAEVGRRDDTARAAGMPVEDGDYFYVYKEGMSRENHYAPSGWMGDYGDLGINENHTRNPVVGDSCIEITYSAEGSAGWSGMYWQDPPNNWGDIDGGYNITGAESLTFWAKGAEGGEHINEFKIGGIRGIYSDTASVTIGPITLSDEWEQYTIDLEGEDLSKIIGGFCWAAAAQYNPDGFTIYLDDIRYNF